MRAGLVSVTFRQLSVDEILSLATKCGLACLEWGGDVHVPHGEISIAREVGRRTRAAGLAITCYGSYYRVGVSPAKGLLFEKVLETASALEAPAIRVWAGDQSSADASEDYRAQVISDALRIAEMARAAGISICYEFHRRTLTDTLESTLALLAATRHPAISSLWQPPHGETVETCLQGLEAILPSLHHIHAFHWWPEPSCRLPLEEGADRWRRYLQCVSAAGKNPDVLLEFVPNDDPAGLERDARTLLRLLAEVG